MQKSLKSIFKEIPGIDERSADMLIASLEKHNQPGFDYLEFKQSLNAMAGLNIDETTAFRTAFATASTVGLTFDHLVNTAKYYKNVLSNERIQFDEALKQQVQRQVAAKENEARELLKAIQLKEQQIKQLEMEIEKGKAQINQLRTDINGANDKIIATKARFEQTFTQIMQEVDKDLEKIAINLQPRS